MNVKRFVGRNSREAQAIQTSMEVLGPGAVLRQVKGEDLDDAAREAVSQDFDAIVAAGGDGTIMTVAGTLMDRGRRFGVLPRETGLGEALSGMGREAQPPLFSWMKTLAA